MEHQEYRTMYALESYYWWFVARRNLVTAIVKAEAEKQSKNDPNTTPKIFDVGCGTGANLAAFKEYGQVFGIDMSTEAIQFCRQRGLHNLSLSKIEALAYLPDSFDIITALDVLEHIDNDNQAIQELYRSCRPGGLLLITVPAYGFLWSEHDEALHHRRRYAGHELRNKLVLAGFEIERCSYFITLLFFPILCIRILQGIFKKSTHPQTSHIELSNTINSLLIGLLALEQYLFKYINLPFGVSIVCLARKPLKAITASQNNNIVPFERRSNIA